MRLVPADDAHIKPLASRMREADRIEVAALGRTPETALRNGLRGSLWALTALVDDEPHAMLGLVPVNAMVGEACPWMLGSEAIYDHGRDLLRYGPGIVAEMRRGFERLGNVVHTENHRALRFLRRLGFQISEEQEVHGGLTFVRFS